MTRPRTATPAEIRTVLIAGHVPLVTVLFADYAPWTAGVIVGACFVVVLGVMRRVERSTTGGGRDA